MMAELTLPVAPVTAYTPLSHRGGDLPGKCRLGPQSPVARVGRGRTSHRSRLPVITRNECAGDLRRQRISRRAGVDRSSVAAGRQLVVGLLGIGGGGGCGPGARA